MRAIAITNLKGGVGKTTTVVNLGAGLALKGLRVLLVDVDAQGNLATALGVQPRRTLYEVLVDGKPAEHCLTPARPRLDVLAADSSLMTAQPLIAQRPDWAHLLSRSIKPLAARYDVALIDCSASLSVMNVGALLAASDVIVPTVVEHLSLRGIELLEQQLARVGSARIRCVVPTMFDTRQRQAHELLAQLQRRYGALVVAPIRVNVRLSEAPSLGRTIYEHDPRSRGALDYARLVEHIATLLQLQPAVTHADPPAPTLTHAAPPDDSPAPMRAGNQAHDGGEAPRRRARLPVPDLPVFQGVTHEACPSCAHPLKQTIMAGYRVRYCEHCNYQRQELAQGARR